MRRCKPLYLFGVLIASVLALVGGITAFAGMGRTQALVTGEPPENTPSFWQQILENFDWDSFDWENFPFENYDDFPWDQLPWDDMPADFDWNSIPWDNLPEDFPWDKLPFDDPPENFPWDKLPFDDPPENFPYDNVPWTQVPWEDIPWDNMPEDFPWSEMPWEDVPEDFPWEKMPWDDLPEDFPWEKLPWDNLPEDFPWEKLPWQDMGEDFPWEKVPWSKIPPETLPFLAIPWLLVPPSAIPEGALPDDFFPWECEHPYLIAQVREKEPTCGEAGVLRGECIVCKQTVRREIPATGNHTWDDDVCGVCGKYHVVLRSASAKREYDGTPLSEENVTVAGPREHGVDGLMEGHRLVLRFSSLTSVGSRDNTFFAAVVDGAGNDVTDRYVIEKIYGTLEIARRTVLFTTESARKPYDGSPLTREEYTVSGLAAGDRVDFVRFGEGQTEQGRRDNEILDFRIVNGAGEDVTYNYFADFEFGTLTVT